MNDMKTSDVLDLAADKIQEHGWTRGEGWVDEGAGICLEGGIIAAVGMQAPYGTPRDWELRACPAYVAVKDYLAGAGEVGNPDTRLYVWNDRDGRTADEVIEVLRAAAMVERAKEAVGDAYDAEDQPLPVEQKVAA